MDLGKEYQEALAKLVSRKTSQLQELDDWLHQRMHECSQGHKLSPDDVVKAMEWKLKRGKWRPRLLSLIKSNDDEHIQECLNKARECLQKQEEENILAAVQHLTALKGVGPATASLILSIEFPSVPFMSDEAMMAFKECVPIKYTLKSFQVFLKHLSKQAKALDIPPRLLEKQLWAKHILESENKPQKRKRS